MKKAPRQPNRSGQGNAFVYLARSECNEVEEEMAACGSIGGNACLAFVRMSGPIIDKITNFVKAANCLKENLAIELCRDLLSVHHYGNAACHPGWRYRCLAWDAT